MSGLYYENFEVGQIIDHERRRTVTEADNQRFCDMTMNQQPLHLDAAFAAETPFGERVVNGLYTTSLTTDGTIVANLSYDDVEHPEPVFHGDTIRAESEVLAKRETSDGERGVVRMAVRAYRVELEGQDTLVCSFERTVLSLKKSA